MPLLFSPGQHAALEDVSRSLVPGEHLFAFLDDMYVVSKPGRAGRVHDLLAAALWRQSGIRIHHRKTQVWNRARIRPDVCDRLERVVQVVRPEARVWRGSMLPTDRQGVKVLGTPLGHPHYVARPLQGIVEEHQTLLDRIPHVKDLQSAWLLLLHCALARANYQLRSVDPASTGEFSEAHDQGIWQCLCNILQNRPHTGADSERHRFIASPVGRSRAAQCKTDSSGQVGQIACR